MQQPAGDFFLVPASADQANEDMRAALRIPAARRMFRRLLSASRVLGVSFGNDARSTEYNEGVRAVGLWLAAAIETAEPGGLAGLMLESVPEHAGKR